MKKIMPIVAVLCLVVVLAVYFRPEPEVIDWEEYVVSGGETISDISQSITPNSEDYRETQHDIIEKNNLENKNIYPGQEILIPSKEETTPKSLGVFKLTAYCACNKCCGKSNGITASGAKAVEGVTVAADTRFPFGTKLIIGGHEYTVQDRGSSVKGDKIDIFFSSHQSAIKFGVQYKEVFAG